MSKTNLAEASAEPAMSESERLKAVRDLIFGENMAEYQKEFSLLREQIAEHQIIAQEKLASESAALSEKLDALEYSFDQSLKKFKQEVVQHVDRLEGVSAEIVENRQEVGRALAQIAEVLQK
ncbi:MAG: hypothetical protein WBM41_10615 [Arenicellales bacterium]